MSHQVRAVFYKVDKRSQSVRDRRELRKAAKISQWCFEPTIRITARDHIMPKSGRLVVASVRFESERPLRPRINGANDNAAASAVAISLLVRSI